MRSVLHGIRGPQDLRDLSVEELRTLSQEIRDFLIEKVSRSGGHLGPNLGVVELTVALHRVFDCPTDVLLWDTGHQSYVHKMLTGRLANFDSLRREGGMSGYPSRAESDADVIENSHASTVLSYADGISRAFELQGVLADRHVVAVVGDGALTGGMSWEALNNIAGSPDRPVVMVVNDNERSYSPTIGGLAHHLSTLRTTHGYERFLDWGRRALTGTPVVGQPVYDTLHAVKAGLKDALAPQGLFEDLGLKYIGPVDGHDIPALEHALKRAKAYAGPVIVHVITEKGRGYSFAEADVAEKFHAVAAMDPETGLPLKAGVPTWTGAFSKELVAIGEERQDVVAITAAMLGPTGLERFARAFPDRTIDVGIAEQHAATSAAGMAYAGLHPVVAVYATFLNRAFDQVLMDCALHRAGVTFVLDRAGVTGDDGASHNGVWDLAVLQVVPGLRIAAPRDAQTLALALREAVDVADAPTVVRFPKGALPADITAIERTDHEDVLYRNGSDDVLVIGVGALAPLAIDVADRLVDQGIGVTVVDPRWVSPVAASLVERASGFSLVVVVEDGVRAGGVAGAITRAMQDAGVDVPLRGFGVPVEFLDHGSRANVLSRIGLTAQDVSRAVVEAVARREPPFTGVESGSADPAPRQGTGSV